MNQTLWRTIQLDSGSVDWSSPSELPRALDNIRSLVCRTTGKTPHHLFFGNKRRANNKRKSTAHPTVDVNLPIWMEVGRQVIYRPLKKQTVVEVTRQLSLYHVEVKFPRGRLDTVSTRHLAPFPVAPIAPPAETAPPAPVLSQENTDSEIIATHTVEFNQLDETVQALDQTVGFGQQDETIPALDQTVGFGQQDEPIPTLEQTVGFGQHDEPIPAPPRRSGRTRRPPDRLSP